MSQVVAPHPRADLDLGPAARSAPHPRPRPTLSAADDALVRGIRQASERAFTELYGRYFRRIYRFAYLRVGNHADAEELTQETFTAIFCSIDGFRGQSSLLTWIYGIARNTVNNHLRRARAQEERLRQAGPGVARPGTPIDACSPEEQLTARSWLDSVRRSFEAVTPWQVEVFRLRHLENLTIREIALRTSRSNDAIRSSLYRVKRLLLEPDDGFAGLRPEGGGARAPHRGRLAAPAGEGA